MSQADQGISADNLVDVPLKRKRGRPRKYPKLNYDETDLIGKNRGKKHLETMPISPGSGVNGNPSHPANPIQSAADGMLGQVVSGVIEAVFEAGYLLCVRVGNSGITLRGVVFKPGHYIPVSADNDVAPDVQMIRRNIVPFATGSHTHGYNARSKNGEVLSPHESSTVKLGFHTPHSSRDASKDKSLSSLFAQISPSGSSRGNMIPVVLQSATKITNGPSVATESFGIQTTDMESSKGKEILIGTFPSNESAPTNVTVEIENFPFQPQTSQPVLQDDVSVENSSHNQSSVLELHDLEIKPMKLPSTPFENLVTEVIKRIQAPSLCAEMQTENNKATGKLSGKECEESSEVVANIMDGPLMIEPLKAVQPPLLHDSPVSIPKALDDESRTGKMTELLQVLQENMMQNPEPWVEVQNPGVLLKSEDELGESKTEIGEEETGNQKQI